MKHSAKPPASRTRWSGGSRFRQGAGSRRCAVSGPWSPSGRRSARKAGFRKPPPGSGFPLPPKPDTVGASFPGGAGSLAIRKTTASGHGPLPSETASGSHHDRFIMPTLEESTLTKATNRTIPPRTAAAFVGIDLAKHSVPVHGVDDAGRPGVDRQRKPAKRKAFRSHLAPCVVGMEACGRAHPWGRECAAGLGWVPKPDATGGKERLPGISKRGDRDRRGLRIDGARARVTPLSRKAKRDRRRQWLQGLLERRHQNVATGALANRMAPTASAVLTSRKPYEENHGLA